MIDPATFAFKIILLHLLSGQVIELNGAQISSLARVKKDVIAPSGCVVHMVNRTFFSVIEECEDIAKTLRGDP